MNGDTGYYGEWVKEGNFLLYIITFFVSFMIILIYGSTFGLNLPVLDQGDYIAGLIALIVCLAFPTPICILLWCAHKNQHNIMRRQFLFNTKFILKKLELVLDSEKLQYTKLSVNGKVRSNLLSYREIFEVNNGTLFIRVSTNTSNGIFIELGPVNDKNELLLDILKKKIDEALPQKYEDGQLRLGSEKMFGDIPVIYIGKYRRDQWQLLIESAFDREKLPSSFEEWQKETSKIIVKQKKKGAKILEFEFDVPGLLEYCKKHNLPNNEQARTGYSTELLNKIYPPEPNPYFFDIKENKK
ncbi:hypothetical protein [[Eubacterium] cellulosolvens]